MVTKATKHTQSLVATPKVWGEKFSEDDKQKTIQVIDWLNEGQEHVPGFENQRTQKKLSRSSGVHFTTLNTILKGTYPSPPGKHLDKLIDTISRSNDRDQEVMITPIVETSVYRAVNAACVRAHKYRNFGVVSAFVGTGKTTALKHYANTHANVYLVEADPDMNASVLVTTLVEITNAVVHKTNKYGTGTKPEKMRAIINTLKGTDSLLIIDEAETVTTQTLEYVRRISDKAEIGVVLAGTQKLKPLIKDPQGRFGQISSRVSFWPAVIKGITEKDANQITQAAMIQDGVELTENVLDAFWQMSDGSARVLANSLIPGVRDYGLRRSKELTPDLIYKVGQELLGFKRPQRRV